jgi:hypothetical protein
VGETGLPISLSHVEGGESTGKTGSRYRSSSTPNRPSPQPTFLRRRRSESGLAAIHSWLVGLANGLLCVTARRAEGRRKGRQSAASFESGYLHRHSLDLTRAGGGGGGCGGGDSGQRRPERRNTAPATKALDRTMSSRPEVWTPPPPPNLVVTAPNGQPTMVNNPHENNMSSTQLAPAVYRVPTTTSSSTYVAATQPAAPLVGEGASGNQAGQTSGLYSSMATVLPRIPTWQRQV